MRVYSHNAALTPLERHQLRERADRFLTTAAMLERQGDLPAAIAARDRADHLLASACYPVSAIVRHPETR